MLCSEAIVVVYSGCGNTFAMVYHDVSLGKEEGELHIAADTLHWALQNRHCDGAIFVHPYSSPEEYRMRIFNSDHSEAEMCGNGLRCVGAFLRDSGKIPYGKVVPVVVGLRGETRRLTVEVLEETGKVRCCMGTILSPMAVPMVSVPGRAVAFLGDTGVPHLVILVDSLAALEAVDLASEGSPLRWAFNANVNFITCLADEMVYVRTYERGVEAETLACGTGCVAAALVA